MRTIKFRAWSIDYKKMLPVHDAKFVDGRMIGAKGIGWEDTVEVMQFTGLHDKNGKEIYEGDVVKGIVKRVQLLTWDTDENCNTKMVGEVYYDYCGFSLKVIQNLCDKEREGMVNYFNFINTDDGDFDEMEVIGNIYENPDLLS